MINVKGTKQALPEDDAAQRYVLKNGDEVSRTPLVVVSLLTGVAAYLSSIFSWGRERDPQSQPEEPDASAGVAAESDSPVDLVHETDPPQAFTDTADDAPPGSAAPGVVDAPRSMPFRYPGEYDSVSVIAGSASGNAGVAWTDRVSSGAGTPSIDMASPGGHRAPLGSDGPSGGELPPNEGSSAGVDGPTDGGGSPDGESLAPEGDDDDAIRPDGNRAPRVSGPVYLLDVAPCVALPIAFDALLSKAEDPDGDALSVQNLAVSSGTLTQAEDGWVFQSDSGYAGPVTLSYQITDGELTADAVARFSVVEPPAIPGTAANDMLLGSLYADEIDGAGGDDIIDGRAGDDVLTGGRGDDHIVAGGGDDVVVGGDGEDIIFGGAGNDHLFGDSGDDRLFGGDGDDVLFGNAGADHLHGGDGDDLMFGGDGDDVMADGVGRDEAFGGMGNDRVVAALDADNDVYDGGANSDTLDYSQAEAGLLVDLVNGVANGVEIGHDAISGFEKVLGSRGADQFILGGESIVLTGGTGDDVFAFVSGDVDQPNAVSHAVMDFGVGDRIRLSEYEIFWKADDEPQGRFEHIYRNEGGDDLPIRYRHDRDDGHEWTVIETDFEGDEMWVTAVSLQGMYELSWSTERDDGLEWLS